MNLVRTLCLPALFLALSGAALAYPDRAALLEEMETVKALLQKAQSTEGPDCAPGALARAQSFLARAQEELEEGDLWEAEDLLKLCRKAAEGITERILSCGRDLDRDGIPDRKDRCPGAPETYNDYMDGDGCPDRVPVQAMLTPDKVEILVPIRFDEKTQQPLPASAPVLADVARILLENPGLRLRIEAHLDARLPPEEADRITQMRAEAVRAALVAQGIAEARLDARGKGSREPIASNTSPQGRALNRRVEFIRIP